MNTERTVLQFKPVDSTRRVLVQVVVKTDGLVKTIKELPAETLESIQRIAMACGDDWHDHVARL